MATGIVSWSQTAASNATADSNVNWAEGQAPSSVNDSARAMMASVAKWRDDVTGTNVTGGTGTAYTLTSNQTIASNLNGFTIQFTPGTTNTGAVTLSVDSQTAKPIRFKTGVDLPSGALISGSLYQATYRSSVEEWLLHSFDASVYAIPLGGSIDYWGATAPNSAFVLPYGQAISRTVYSGLFAIFSTTFGTGDGSTTFNIPDLRGRVVAGLDGMGGSNASRLTGASMTSLVMGGTGGAQTVTLTTAEMPAHTHSGTTGSNSVDHTHSESIPSGAVNAGSGFDVAAIASSATQQSGGESQSHTHNFTTGSSGGGGAHTNVQPTILANKLLRII